MTAPKSMLTAPLAIAGLQTLSADHTRLQQGIVGMPDSHTLIRRLVHIENLPVLLQRRGLHAPNATPNSLPICIVE